MALAAFVTCIRQQRCFLQIPQVTFACVSFNRTVSQLLLAERECGRRILKISKCRSRDKQRGRVLAVATGTSS